MELCFRYLPVRRYVRALVRDGFVGEVHETWGTAATLIREKPVRDPDTSRSLGRCLDRGQGRLYSRDS